jgi:hypothetical protein
MTHLNAEGDERINKITLAPYQAGEIGALCICIFGVVMFMYVRTNAVKKKETVT